MPDIQSEKIGDRIKELRLSMNLSQKEFAEKLELKQPHIPPIEKGERTPGRRILNDISSVFNVNMEWLLYGTGEMISNGVKEHVQSPINLPIEENSLGVPVLDAEFSAGTLKSIEQVRNNAKVLAWLNIPEVRGCDYIIRVRGDSMADVMNDRDYVGIKRIYDLDVIPPGHAYAIITDELELVKYLRKGSTEDLLLVRSHNEIYEDFELPKNKIKQLYAVRVVIPFSKIRTLI